MIGIGDPQDSIFRFKIKIGDPQDSIFRSKIGSTTEDFENLVTNLETAGIESAAMNYVIIHGQNTFHQSYMFV